MPLAGNSIALLLYMFSWGVKINCNPMNVSRCFFHRRIFEFLLYLLLSYYMHANVIWRGVIRCVTRNVVKENMHIKIEKKSQYKQALSHGNIVILIVPFKLIQVYVIQLQLNREPIYSYIHHQKMKIRYISSNPAHSYTDYTYSHSSPRITTRKQKTRKALSTRDSGQIAHAQFLDKTGSHTHTVYIHIRMFIHTD